jgi:hypothetical protein
MKIGKTVGAVLSGIGSMILYDTVRAVFSEVRCQYRSFVRGKIRKVAKIDDVSTQDLMKDGL